MTTIFSLQILNLKARHSKLHCELCLKKSESYYLISGSQLCDKAAERSKETFKSKLSELVRVRNGEVRRHNSRLSHINYRFRLLARRSVSLSMGVKCHNTSNDETVMKMKQYFKQNFIYICLGLACLSLVSKSIKNSSLESLTSTYEFSDLNRVKRNFDLRTAANYLLCSCAR